jgi:hypothetical protein
MPNEQQAAEVNWYQLHGRFPRDRIATDRDGAPYVIGDVAWNRWYPDRYEPIEHLMPRVPICRESQDSRAEKGKPE